MFKTVLTFLMALFYVWFAGNNVNFPSKVMHSEIVINKWYHPPQNIFFRFYKHIGTFWDHLVIVKYEDFAVTEHWAICNKAWYIQIIFLH